MVIGGSPNSLSSFQPSKDAWRDAYLDEEALSGSWRRCLQDDRRHSSKELINTEYRECVYTRCKPCRKNPPRIMSVSLQVWINCLWCASPEKIRIQTSRTNYRWVGCWTQHKSVLRCWLWKWVPLPISGNVWSRLIYVSINASGCIYIRAQTHNMHLPNVPQQSE